MSLSFQAFPDRLKVSVVKPVSKNGDRLITLNYRPISLLTSSLRSFEILIYARYINYIDCIIDLGFLDQRKQAKDAVGTEFKLK